MGMRNGGWRFQLNRLIYPQVRGKQVATLQYVVVRRYYLKWRGLKNKGIGSRYNEAGGRHR
jgi:hypothetical protein